MYRTIPLQAMINQRINPLPGAQLSPVQVCQNQHQTWATMLVQSEQEIDLLLTRLAALPDDTYPRLYHRAVDYMGDLNRLKSHFQRLRLSTTCEGSACTAEGQGCREPHFGLYALIEGHFQPLIEEFSRVKVGCYQFLSVMVRLNLI